MLTTIIYAHPYDRSFNRAIFDTVIESLAAKGKEYALIDLYADRFNPVLTREELEVYPNGGSKDPLVENYNAILDETEKAIFIFPIWWYDCPAILKGFFDKVMLPGSAYKSTDKGLVGIRNIKDTLIVTTSSAPTSALINNLGDSINRMMIGATFNAVGLYGARWENLGGIGNSTEEDRKAFLKKIREMA